MDYSKIKLIIWDLDDTFWTGTLSEQGVTLKNESIDLLVNSTECGIINSICSKNDFNEAKKELSRMGIWDLFVAPSINWEPKGKRIKSIINSLNFRNENVLFIDDNAHVLKEVEYYNKKIMTAFPKIIVDLNKYILNNRAVFGGASRLQKYKIIENKLTDKNQFASNNEFLKSCQIHLEIKSDCINNFDRIYELFSRTNQLNFTKRRLSEAQLMDLLNDKDYKCRYYVVTDAYGDYGIVGFSSLHEGKLYDFLFSCRILGMGIEKYVFRTLGSPQLNILGEVKSDLHSIEEINWINLEKDTNKSIDKKEAYQIYYQNDQSSNKKPFLIKGPCDLYAIFPFIKQRDLFKTDFTHVDKNGVVIETTGHTSHILESLMFTNNQKEMLVAEIPFIDPNSFSDEIFTGNFDYVILSTLLEGNAGVYKRKITGEKVAFLEYSHPITEPENWDKYIADKFYTAGFKFTLEFLQEFSKRYDFIGRNSPNEVASNLIEIYNKLPSKTKLIILLGSEISSPDKEIDNYFNRHIYHKELNKLLINNEFDSDRVFFIDVDEYLINKDSFTDQYNHYSKSVYYELAKRIVEIINEGSQQQIKCTAPLKVAQQSIKSGLGDLYYRLKKKGR